MFTRARHWSLSWARWIQSITPHRIPLRTISILSFRLSQGLPSGLFFSGSHTTTLYPYIVSPRRATYPFHHILLHFIIPIILAKGTNYEAPHYGILDIGKNTKLYLTDNLARYLISFNICILAPSSPFLSCVIWRRFQYQEHTALDDGIGCGITDVLPQNLPGGTGESDEKSRFEPNNVPQGYI
jgi:hypothetical protein